MNTIRKIAAQKRIALVAHDHMKKELVDWAEYNKQNLNTHILYGTGTTGSLLEKYTGLKVNKLLSGPMGGDLQIGALTAEGKLDVIVFFWDPMEAQPHDPDIKALLRIAAVWNIPLACNRASADFLISSPLMDSDYAAILVDYSQYMSRSIPM